MFHRDRFVCRAISEEHAGEAVTLKDIEAARRAHRQALRAGIGERIARVADFLPMSGGPAQTTVPPEAPLRARTRLRLYEEDD